MRSKRSESSCPHTNGKTTPQKRQDLPGVSQGVGTRGQRGLWLPAGPALPVFRFPRFQAGSWEAEAEAEKGREVLHPARVRQEGPSGKEGTPPPPPRPHLGSAGGQGGRPAPGSSESGLPPRTAPRGPPDGPAARPAKQAGNGRLGCLERSRRQQGRGPDWVRLPEGRGGAARLRVGTRKAV